MAFEWVPQKFKDRPWITIGVFVVAIVVLTLLGVYVLVQVADTLGADWVRGTLDKSIGEVINSTDKP